MTSNRTAATLGFVSVATMLAAFPLGADEPAANASAATAVAYWSQHDGSQSIASIAYAVSAAALVGFGAGMRQAIRDKGAGELASIAFGAVVIAAVGVLTVVGIALTAADTAGHVTPQVTQTLSALNADLVLPTAIGFGLLLIACGAAAIKTELLPPWLGWLSLLLGASAFTPAVIVAYIATPVWLLTVSALMLRPDSHATADRDHHSEVDSRHRAAIDLAPRG